MQPTQQWQDQTLARFMHVSRRHLGLMQAPVAVRPPRRVAGPSRQILRSLIVAGSLGALFGGSAFATEASRQADPTKRSQSTHGARAKADERQDLSHKPSLSGKFR
jgi:hypothetical protein